MADKISVTTRNSYGSRLKSSFGKIFGWIILVILSIILLARNEHRSINQKRALNEWAEIVVETTSTELDKTLDGKEVHVYGDTSSPAQALEDSIFGITTNDLKLARNVEMYQWDESQDEECTDNLWWSETCTTTYEYYKTWSDQKIDSSSFYETQWHTNPANWEYESTETAKSPIQLGVYTLWDVFVWKLSNYTDIDLSAQNITVPSKYWEEKTAETTTNTEEPANDVEKNNDDYLYWDQTWDETEIETTTPIDNAAIKNYEWLHIYADHIYVWKNENDPQIWDLKITFSSVKTGTISIVWMQTDDELTSYTTSNDRSIALLENGKVNAETMFLHAQQANKALTWILRLFWLFLMYAGFNMMFEFFVTLWKVLPFLSKIIGFSTWIASFCLTLTLWFLTIGLAWIAVRPVLWICCLVVSAAGIILLIKMKKNKKSKTSPEAKPGNTPEPDAEVIEC